MCPDGRRPRVGLPLTFLTPFQAPAPSPALLLPPNPTQSPPREIEDVTRCCKCRGPTTIFAERTPHSRYALACNKRLFSFVIGMIKSLSIVREFRESCSSYTNFHDLRSLDLALPSPSLGRRRRDCCCCWIHLSLPLCRSFRERPSTACVILISVKYRKRRLEYFTTQFFRLRIGGVSPPS